MRSLALTGSRRRGWLLAVAIVAVAFLAGSWEAQRARGSDPDDPVWIWLTGDWRRVEPVAFLAVRDVDLPEAPARAVFRVVGDEEYALFVNGWRVGSGRHFAEPGRGAVRDGWDVTEHLRAGANRVLLELRSARGGGGFLASLEVTPPGATEPAIYAASGPGWRLFRQDAWTVRTGLALASTGEVPLVLGPPPRGRWGRPTEGPVWPGPPASRLQEPGEGQPSRGRSLAPLSPWYTAWATRTFSPALWGATLLDWGKAVEGQLEIEFGPREAGRGLVLYGLTAPPNPQGVADGLVVPLTGSDVWRDAVPRRFRYALVIAERRPLAARVLDDPAGRAAWRPPAQRDGAPSRQGVFGIEVRTLRAPMENKLRREFEGLASLTSGEGI